MADSPRIVRADPIPENILATLQHEGNEGRGVPAYPDRLKTRFRQSQLAAALGELAGMVEPVDRALGIDREKPVAKAFRAGGLIGLRVVAACVDDVDRALLDVALLPSPERAADADRLHTRQLFANNILDIGDEAYAGVDEVFNPLFEDWEDRLVPEVRYQRFLRSGFGLPMSFLFARYSENQALSRAADLADMKAQIEATSADGFDWDALLG